MEHLNLTRRQLSNIVAFILIMSFFIFIFGYYLGKKDLKKSKNSSKDNKKLNYNIDSRSKNNSLNNLNNLDDLDLSKKSDANNKDLNNKNLDNNKKSDTSSNFLKSSFYYAELSGFGKLIYAKKYEQETLKGFPVMTIERVGKASNGDIRRWYQVVTEPQVDINKLNNTVDQIKKLAKLKDVRILKLSLKQKEDLQTKVI